MKILNPTIVGTLTGILIGWALSFFTDLVRERMKKNKLIKSLFVELQLNEGVVSCRYLYFVNRFKSSVPPIFSEKEKNIFLNPLLKLTLREELGWGFKTSAYDKAESEGMLFELPTYGEIVEIYRVIFLLQKYGIPRDKIGWTKAREKLEYLEKSLKLVIENFHKNQEEWIKVTQRELQKKKRDRI